MRPSLSCLTDPAALLVGDASAVINVNATGCARDIFQALPHRVVLVDVVVAELAAGQRRGRQDADLVSQFVAQGLLHIETLSDAATLYFEALVVGQAAHTLDDGEAATIAHAVDRQGIALIDERKATRICAEHFPDLRVGCSVDILAHPALQRHLGDETLARAVFNALYHGRMRVFPHHLNWVVGLIGPDRAAMCTSLPQSVRVLPRVERS